MTTRNYLAQITHLEDSIKTKRERAKAYYELAGSPGSVNLTGMPRNPSPSQSPMADAICKAIDLENEVKAEEELLNRKKLFLLDMIGRLSCRDYQTVLLQRYINHMSWDNISAKLYYTTRWVYKLHDRAMDELDTLFAKETDIP